MQKEMTEEQKHQVISRQVFGILEANAEMHGKDLDVTFRHEGVDIFLAVNGIERCRFECKALKQKDVDFVETTQFS